MESKSGKRAGVNERVVKLMNGGIEEFPVQNSVDPVNRKVGDYEKDEYGEQHVKPSTDRSSIIRNIDIKLSVIIFKGPM